MISKVSICNLLIADVDSGVASTLRLNLHSEGYAVDYQSDIETIENINLSAYCLLIIDIPNIDRAATEISIIKHRYPSLNIIYCSAAATGAAVVSVLDAGADYCVSKPFSLREMLARVRALLLRRQVMPDHDSNNKLEYGALTLDLEGRVAYTAAGDIVLSVTELALLEMLMRADSYVSRNDILQTIWPESDGSNPRVVDTNISRLRRKLLPAGITILNRSGVGYRLA